MKKTAGILFFTLLFIVVGYGAQNGAARYWNLSDETVAAVNGYPILYTDVRLYQLLFNENSFENALQRVIDIYAVSQYAISKGMSIPSKKLQEVIEHFAKTQGLSVDELYKLLEQNGISAEAFKNFIYRYNLYVGAIQFFVIKPLLSDRERLKQLIGLEAANKPLKYKLELLKIPLKVAEKNTDLLATLNFNLISKRLGIEPISLIVSAQEVSKRFASLLKRMKPGETNFFQEGNFLYIVRLKTTFRELSPTQEQKLIAKIEEEKIEEFVQKLRNEAVIRIIDEAPKVFLPKGG